MEKGIPISETQNKKYRVLKVYLYMYVFLYILKDTVYFQEKKEKNLQCNMYHLFPF